MKSISNESRSVCRFAAAGLMGIALVLAGCAGGQGAKEVQKVTVQADSLESPASIHASGLVKSVDIVSLDADSVMMGNIDRIVRNGELLYLLDKQQGKCVHVYTLDGRHISTIARQGHGSNEYAELSDVFVNPNDGTLNLLSRVDRKLLVYDRKGKRLMETKRLPKSFSSMAAIEGGGYVGYMGNFSEDKQQPYNFWTLSDALEITGQFGEILPFRESRTLPDQRVFSSFDEGVDLISEYSYAVGRIADGQTQAQPLFRYDFGKYDLPEGLTKEQLDDPAKNFRLQNESVCNLYLFQQTESYCLALILLQGQYLLLRYDKSAGTTQALSLDTYEGDYVCGVSKILGMDEDYIMGLEDAASLYDIWVGHNEYNNFEELYPEQVKNLRRKFSKIDPDGNPFLILYKLSGELAVGPHAGVRGDR